jgi:hypothetical protein
MIRLHYVIRHECNLQTSKHDNNCSIDPRIGLIRNTRFEQYLQNIDHSIDFVNEALSTGVCACHRTCSCDCHVERVLCSMLSRLTDGTSHIESSDE